MAYIVVEPPTHQQSRRFSAGRLREKTELDTCAEHQPQPRQLYQQAKRAEPTLCLAAKKRSLERRSEEKRQQRQFVHDAPRKALTIDTERRGIPDHQIGKAKRRVGHEIR